MNYPRSVRRRLLLVLACALVVNGCDSPTGPLAVSSVTVTLPAGSMVVGDTMTAVAIARDASGNVLPDRAITWSSSDVAIASVDGTGQVAALAPGVVVITARSEGTEGSASITVSLPPLDPPTDVAVERRSRLRARVTWTAVADADRYRIERRDTLEMSWTALETVAELAFTDGSTRVRGVIYEYRVTALGGERVSPPSAVVATVVPAVRLAMIGDSNLERGKSGATTVATSYVSGTSQAIDTGAYLDHPKLTSGKVMGLRPDVEAVNHGIASTGTGTGTVWAHPHALHAISGITRFEAEVLGRGFPWTAAGITRVNAFTPTAADFAYYSLGINDIAAGMSPTAIRDNIAVAIDLWLGAGLPAAHLMVTTLGPHSTHTNRANIPITNALIRTLIASRGVSLVDIAALVSDDDGLSWKNPDLHIGSGLHYSEATLDLIAAEVVRVMASRMP